MLITVGLRCGDGPSSSLNITVINKPTTPVISQNGNILHSNAAVGNQWYNQNGIINGVTSQDYSVSMNGNYYDIVTVSGCSSDTSNNIYVVITGTQFNENNCIIGNSNGSATSTGAGMFTLNSTGYSSTNSDVQESVFQNLNGNGSIIARVVDLTGGGWAGVQIRESCSPGAKKVLLKTQLQTILKAEVRQTSGGGTISTQIMRQGVKWLKLVRTANRFDEYTSVDGVAWMSAFSTTLVMNSCVQIGVFSEGLSFSRSYQARFDNVVVAGSLCAPASKSTEVEGLNENSVPDSQLSIYPNPASKTVHVEIAKTASKVTLSILSLEGKLIRSGRIENSSSQIDVSALKPGIYILRFDLDGTLILKRLVII